ncbi:11137_t:CDS:2 [Funneliformis geosporum]|uniref:17392_t:CDS:1 n=1 Tax=Funneliformis geosporum TaxID=1117311 RepID=A0A9W4SQW1_9GLOM|nr:17392_t:CDS:2 [Funneliformis geosporum]CAI2182731.1 11137_t:CDS:2 [Funneliformis geosporum]
MKENPPLQHNGPTSAPAPAPSGRRQSIIAPQQPTILSQGNLQPMNMQLSMRPNFQTMNQTSLQQTNINHTGLQSIQRQSPIAPGMQQASPGMLQESQQQHLSPGRGLQYPTSRQSAPSVGAPVTNVSPRLPRQLSTLKQSTQTPPIMSTVGVSTFQNVPGPLPPSSRVPPGVAPGIRQAMNPPSQFYQYPVVDPNPYRSGPNVRQPSVGSGRINLPPQQSSHQTIVNTSSIQHNYHPLHHTSQQSNPPMLPPQSMQPHLSPRLSAHGDLQSNSARTTRPQMPMHDIRQSISSTSTPHMLTQGVQQLSIRSSVQETNSKSTQGIPHTTLRPAEGQRSVQESGPQAMQGIQPISHTSGRTSSQSYIPDMPQQIQSSQRSTPKLLPQTLPQQVTHNNSTMQLQQRISQKQSSPLIPQAIVKTSHTSPKFSSTKSSHRSHKGGHHGSQKTIPQTSQLTVSQQKAAEKQVTEAARVLYMSSMSSRSRDDPQRLMNSDFSFQYAAVNNIHINTSNNHNHTHHRSSRYSGPIPDITISRDENMSREQEIGLVPHNRGHKMKNRAEALDSGVKLRAPYGYIEDKEEVEIPHGTRRPIIYRTNKETTNQATEFEGDPNDNPYKDINVEDILGPLEKPEDAVRKPHYRRILKSKHLESLAKELMERIEKEHEFNKKISRLMIVFQGDDVMHQDLDFRLNPPPETVSTRVVKAEEVEGGKNFGVLNVGLQGNDRSKGKRAQEAKDQGLLTLNTVREQLQEQLENSNEILRRYNETRESVLKAIRQKNMIYKRLCEIDKQQVKSNVAPTALSLNA